MSSNEIFPLVPAGWRSTTLGELAKESGGSIQTGPFGSQLHAADYVDEGIPSIMPKNIRIDGVDTSDIARVSPKDVERLAKHKVLAGDVVYSRRGDVEKCCLITSGEEGWLCGTGCLRVRIPSSVLSPVFLHAYLCHPAVREWIVRHAIGATMPNLNTSILSALPILVPPINEAESVADIWALVSRKISLNTQTNQTLEQMVQALFKSWFVDFDPVFDNALDSGFFEREFQGEGIPEPLASRVAVRRAIRQAGREGMRQAAPEEMRPAIEPAQGAHSGTAISAAPGTASQDTAAVNASHSLPADIRALFPASFVEHPDLGWIPEGWEVLTADSVADVTIGKTPPRKESQWFSDTPSQNVTWVSIKDMGNAGPFVLDSSEYLVPDAVDKFNIKTVPAGSVLLSFKLTLGRVCMVKSTLTTNEAIAHFSNYRKGLNRDFIYCYLKQFNYEMLGSTSSIATAVNSKIIKAMSVLVPSGRASQMFSELVAPWFDMVLSRSEENRELTNLRDTLLPKLLSGELTLAEEGPERDWVDEDLAPTKTKKVQV